MNNKVMNKYNDKKSDESRKDNSKYKNNIIIDALRYHDFNSEKYDKFYKKVHYVTFKYTDNDLEHNTILFHDKNDNIIFESRYEIIGVYDTIGKAWTWAWATPRLTKNKIQLIKKVLNYGIDLDPQQIFLKTELVTSRFRISNDIQLDIHTALASYLSKQPLTYKYVINNESVTGIQNDSKSSVGNQKISLQIFEYLFLLDYEKLNLSDKQIEED